ncbi:hypothetical protein BFP97_00780 [Roseivirga sp. 4D4]|uniref:FAD-binding oxidoreductase n=1 Tax=Roseivirga sp. 4D4 TaxID=1889784 RepID=UPI0008539B65|nr:FAD-binding oxidoreductase [Roseivirga sp. 4D4]OEK00137.1 hypothetical protein BFP97_00780 [Roseivirga sp. 4D4]
MEIDNIYSNLIRALPALEVFHKEEDLYDYNQNTFSSTSVVKLVAKPKNRDELVDLVKLAYKHRFKLYPFSQGKNWGLGSKLPPNPECLLVDLSRLNRICEHNEKYGIVRVEAGVSFQDLYQFLERFDSNLWLPVIGGSPDASIIGNFLERGHGLGPYGDRVQWVTHLEVVMPDGTLVETGQRIGESLALDKYGVGPNLDRLFTQSNFGIVISANLQLRPCAGFHQVFQFSIDADSNLGVIDYVQKAMHKGLIQDNCFSLWNYEKATAVMGSRIVKHTESNEWFGSITHYSPERSIGLAYREIIEMELKNHVITLEVQDQDSHPDLLWTKAYGVPDYKNLKSAYVYENGMPESPDLDLDNCGIIWLCPAVPFSESDVTVMGRVVSEENQKLNNKDFQLQAGFNALDPLCLRFALAIVYKRSKEADLAALHYHDSLMEKLIKLGYPPFRLGVQSMQFGQYSQEIRALNKRIKKSIDPFEIISPGRYG